MIHQLCVHSFLGHRETVLDQVTSDFPNNLYKKMSTIVPDLTIEQETFFSHYTTLLNLNKKRNDNYKNSVSHYCDYD